MKGESYTIRTLLSIILLLVLLYSIVSAQSKRIKRTTQPTPTKVETTEKLQPAQSSQDKQKPLASEGAPSLKEASDWLKNKLETTAGYKDEKSGIEENYPTATIDGCAVKYVRYFRIGSVVMKAAGLDDPSRREVAFNLKDIDVPSIKVKSDAANNYRVWFQAIEGKDRIRFGDYFRPDTEIYFTEQEEANRFAKALAHAIKLCQSQKEPF